MYSLLFTSFMLCIVYGLLCLCSVLFIAYFVYAGYSLLFTLQLKHASRYVHDLLTTLAKNLNTELIQYLLGLVSSLPVASHNKQTLCLASVLTRLVWNNALSSHHHHHQQHTQGTLARRNSPTSSTAVVGGTSCKQNIGGRGHTLGGYFSGYLS